MTDEKYMKEINIGDLLLGYNRATEKRAETDQILKHSFWEIINIIDVDRNAKRIAVIPENKLNRVASLFWDDDVCFAPRRLCSSADEILICTPENAFECLGELL